MARPASKAFLRALAVSSVKPNLRPDRLRFCSCREKVKGSAAEQHAAKHMRLKDGHQFISFSAWRKGMG